MNRSQSHNTGNDNIWKAVFNSVEDIAIIINPEFVIENINRKGIEVFGDSSKGPVHKKCHEAICNHDCPPENCPLTHYLKNQIPEKDQIIHTKGRYFKVNTTVIRDEKGDIIKFVDILHDITKQLETEKDLKEQVYEYTALNEEYETTIEELEKNNNQLAKAKEQIEEKEKKLKTLQTIINRNPATAFRWKNDAGWPVEYVSENISKLMGYLPEEFYTGVVSYADLIHPDDLERVTKEVLDNSNDDGIESFQHQPYRLKNKNGQYIWVDDHTYIKRKDGQITHYEGIIMDCSDQVVNTRKLEESEEKFRLIAESSGEDIWQLDLDGKITYVSPAVERIFGYTPKEAMNLSFDVFFPPRELERASQAFAKALLGEKYQLLDITAIKKNGSPVQIEVSITPIFQDHQVTGVQGIARDVTEKKKVQQQLQASEKRYKSLFDNSLDAIMIADDTAHYIEANTAAHHLLGYTPGELKTKTLFDITPTPDHETGMKLWKEFIKEGSQKGEFVLMNKNGDPVHVDYVAVSNVMPGMHVSFLRDISDRKRAENALKKVNEQYELLLESITDSVYVLDMNWDHVIVNEAAARFTGIPKEKLLNHNLLELFPGVEFTPFFRSFKRVMETRIPAIVDSEYKFPDGTERWYEVSVYPVPEGILCISKDITKRKKAEKELEFHSMLIDNINDYVTATDLNGNITYVNQKVCHTFNKTREQLIGQHVIIYGDESEQGGTSQHKMVEETRMNGSWQGEVVNVKPDGEKIYLACSLRLLNDQNGEPFGMIGISKDITDRKEYEKQLKFKTEELESQNEEYLALNEELQESLDRIQQINLELHEARKKAEESDRLKSAFLANMSHEIRTPLNGILGFTALLTSNKKITLEKKENYVSIIKKSSEGLLRIIDDILDISRIESGDIEVIKKPVEINPLLREMHSIFKNKLSNKGHIEIVHQPFEREVIVYADENRLRQVFYNLLDNAIKFTDNGKIAFGVAKLDRESLTFFVRDTGVGIPTEKHEIIFERFRQGDNSFNRLYGGNGLGLSITKKLIQIMGGNIWVESETGKGATFMFTLPFYESVPDRTNEPEKHENRKSGFDNETAHILLVEDDATNCLYIEEVFNETNSSLTVATTGKEALKTVKEREFDVILMDIRLPDMSGYDVVKQIRGFNQDVYIIALTAYAMGDDRKNALLAGCNDYIPKPVRGEVILQKIEEVTAK